MKREEINGILELLNAAYPKYYQSFSEKDRVAQARVWELAMSDIDDNETVKHVVLACIRRDNYPPSIAKVREGVKIIQRGRRNKAAIEQHKKLMKELTDGNEE